MLVANRSLKGQVPIKRHFLKDTRRMIKMEKFSKPFSIAVVCYKRSTYKGVLELIELRTYPPNLIWVVPAKEHVLLYRLSFVHSHSDYGRSGFFVLCFLFGLVCTYWRTCANQYPVAL